MKTYVKLKDSGTIFHDASQDTAVTGKLPVAINKNPKVAKAIKNGILIEVPKKEAELSIQAAKVGTETAKEEVIAEAKKVEKLVGANEQLGKDLKSEQDAHSETKVSLKETTEKLQNSEKSLKESNDALAKSEKALKETKDALAKATKK